ncbi:MAG: O-antigen ligase family protein [Planctomycetota bacterium]
MIRNRPEAPAVVLLVLLAAVPLLYNPGLFTNADSPKWALTAIGTLAAVAFILVRALRSKEETTVLLPEHLVILLGAILISLFVGKRAPDARATVRALAAIGTMTSFALIATRYLADGANVRRLVLVVFAVTGVTAIVAVPEILAGTRPSATFGNPSFAAEYAAGALPLALFLWLAGRRRMAIGMAALSAGILLVTASRADLLGAAAGAVVAAALAFAPRRLRRAPWIFALALIALATLLPTAIRMLPIPALGRSDTIEIRDRIRASTIEMGTDHVATGVGLEGFRAHYPKVRDPEEARLSLRREVTFPHNLPLSIFAEAGVPGLLLLLLFVAVPLYSGIRTSFEKRDDAFAPAATGALVAILVSAQFSAPLRHPGSALLFFTLGALLVARRPRRVVTKIKGRYRRTMAAVGLAVPAIMATVTWSPHLIADARLAHATAAALRQADPAGIIETLRSSIRAEPGPGAYRLLAQLQNLEGETVAALATVDSLLAISPWDEAGRIERARALRSEKKLDKAKKLLDELVAARPGDDVSLMLRGLVRGEQGDREGALADILDAMKAAPPDVARRHAALVHTSIADFEPAVIRMAERIGRNDPARALAILEGIGTGEADYYRALVHVAGGRPAEAVRALKSAMGTGYVTLNRLRHDPRLDPIRGHSEFRALVGGG